MAMDSLSPSSVKLNHIEGMSVSLPVCFDVVDLVGNKSDWWVNSGDTLIFSINDSILDETVVTISEIIMWVAKVKPDECDYRIIDGRVVFRMWWD